MEKEKERSRAVNGGKRRRADGDVGEPSATEDEVEEFFAILRRIRAAARQIGGGRQTAVTEKAERWKPTFEWEDFGGVNSVKSDGEVETVTEEGEKKEEEKVAGLDLDLNVEPKPEHAAHFS